MLASTSLGGPGRPQQLQQPDPVAEDLVVNRPVAGQRFPGGKSLGHQGQKSWQIVDEIVDVVALRTDDHRSARGVGGQGGGHQRAARAPDSVERGRMSRLEGGDHLGEAFLPLQASDQLGNPVRRRRNRFGVRHNLRGIVADGRKGRKMSPRITHSTPGNTSLLQATRLRL